MITEADVKKAQNAWAQAIIEIGRVYTDKGDYVASARDVIDTLYDYDKAVLFKPTLASQQAFRLTTDDALSYFVGGSINEDNGFAITPWEKVRFGEQHILTFENHALAMGHYYFTKAGQNEEQKVEFTFGYRPDASGGLKINLHHSSLPYSPAV